MLLDETTKTTRTSEEDLGTWSSLSLILVSCEPTVCLSSSLNAALTRQ